MRVQDFAERLGADFYAGVPDSQLKPLCDYLINLYGTDPRHHVIAANEGNCVALAAGYHLATGKVPVVYLQNSGEGNIINPVASLLHKKVYAIPMIFVIGWRGEPGVHDEPQHIYQGEVTLKLLEDMGISVCVIGKDTTDDEVSDAMKRFREALALGGNAAFVIRKGALSYDEKATYHNRFTMTREEIIRRVVRVSGEDPIVSTTGKASRELYEIREQNGQGHQFAFLTVGSMGHSSSIALGVAIQRPEKQVWCLDGDGAVLMHMGAMAVIGALQPKNLIHVVINNCAHETVGGMPTVAGNIDLTAMARACGYPYAVRANSFEELDCALEEAASRRTLRLIEANCAIGARKDLGRPKTPVMETKRNFMRHLSSSS